jgi:lipid A 4'-phosphatase
MPAASPEPGTPSCVLALAVLAVLGALSAALFALCPTLDLTVAGLFHSPGTGFALSGRPFWDGVLLANKGASLVFVVAAVVLLPAGLLRRNEDSLLWVRYWGLVVLIYLLGPGVLVNGILKRVFGRARPEQIKLFGGDGPFTAAWAVSDYCRAACSFVSAEIAAATALAVGLGIGVMWFRRRPVARLFRSLAVASLVLLLLTALQRLGSGRHFLSDLVFAALPVMALGIALACVLRPRPTPLSPPDSQDHPA